jgi:hypothetical protein
VTSTSRILTRRGWGVIIPRNVAYSALCYVRRNTAIESRRSFVTGADGASIVVGAVAAMLLWSGGLKSIADRGDPRGRPVHVGADSEVLIDVEVVAGGAV